METLWYYAGLFMAQRYKEVVESCNFLWIYLSCSVFFL